MVVLNALGPLVPMLLDEYLNETLLSHHLRLRQVNINTRLSPLVSLFYCRPLAPRNQHSSCLTYLLAIEP